MMPQTSTHWNVGDTILDLYQVLDILGEGGFGKVYKVHHQGWNVDLAVKSPKPEVVAAAGGVESFEREAETWVNLGLHPHTVSCYYVRRIENSPLVFAEYVAGGSLADWIENCTLYEGGTEVALKRILDIAIQFAWGLHYAHEQGLIHQDVKPANVMMTPQGIVKVTDFGLAKGRMNAPVLQEGTEGTHTLITEGSGGMTPAYCSPEQTNGESLTRRTDLWSWAVSVLEMFQGERTWEWGTVAASLLEFYLEMGQDNPQMPQMPESVTQLLWCCFRENPNERPHTMLDVANELKGIYQQVTGETYLRSETNAAKEIADSLNNRAVSLLDLGKDEEACKVWDQALQVQPHHPESTYNWGLILWRSARIDDITLVGGMEQAHTTRAEDWLYNYLLSLVHLERNDSEAAIKTLDRIQGAEAEFIEVKTARTEAIARLSQSKWLLLTFEGHIGGVTSVSLSAYGPLALSGSKDRTLKLWEVATGCCLRTFEGHIGEVTSVSLSIDGRLALSGSKDRTLKLWEVATGRCLRTFEGHTHEVTSVSLNIDGRLALSGSRDRTLKLWEIATGHCLDTGIDTDEVTSVSLSIDGRLALSGSKDRTLKLWEVATGRCLRTFEGHTHEVTSVSLSIDGRLALSGSRDRTLKLWEVTTGRCLRTFEGHTHEVISVTFSGGGRLILSASFRYNTLKLWIVKSETSSYVAPIRLCRVLTSETLLSLNLIYKRKLKQAQVALDRGDYIATAKHIREARSQPGYYHGMEAFNAWINLYSYLPRKAFSTGWEGSTFEGQEPIKLVNSVSLSRDGRLALSGSGDKTLKLWEIATGRCLRTFEGHTDEVYSVSLSADGRFALSGSGDKTLKLWEVATGRCLHTYEGHRDRVYSVSMSADGRFVLSGSGDKTLKLWEIATGHCLHTYEGHRDRVYSVSMSADGRFVLSGSGDKTLKLWEIATGHCLHTFEEHTDKVTSVTLSADSRLALSGSRDGTLKLWEVVGDRYLFPFERYIAAVILSLLESSDKTLKLWEVVIGRCLRTFEGHGNSVRSVSLSTDCSLALSGSDDEPLKLWLFDWKLEDKSPANWNKGARLYLEIFLTQHMPYAATLPKDREPTEEEMTLALTRCGTPTWTEEDFQNLLYTLGCVGYGWLRPEGIRQHLEAMAGIKSTANQKMLISPFIRTNRVAVLIFLASYTYLAILLQSIWSLGWLGSLLLPVVPAFLLAWYLANLAIQRTK